jgi:hypothetical protein
MSEVLDLTDVVDVMKNTGSFVIAIPLLNQFEEAYKWLDSWFCLAKGKLNVLFIDNGSEAKWSEHSGVKAWQKDGHTINIIRNDENVGVFPTFQQAYDATTEPWIFYSHSDVEMRVVGWDERLRHLLEGAFSRGGGACGMFGAKGIGTSDIYKAAYDYRQLARWGCHTVESMVGHGGALVNHDLTECIVLDGFSLIVRRDMIKDTGGFDHEHYPVHHMYDNDICVQSHHGGFKNFVLDLDCIHHGGMTSCREDYAKKFGTTDLNIHRVSSREFYEKWRGTLPVGV